MFEQWREYLEKLTESQQQGVKERLASLSPTLRIVFKRYPPGTLVKGQYVVGYDNGVLLLSPTNPLEDYNKAIAESVSVPLVECG